MTFRVMKAAPVNLRPKWSWSRSSFAIISFDILEYNWKWTQHLCN